ncbi:hypothetical protein OH799_21155 [Nocardia sp. NBC_00881]|uniref:hypothetical protein n=1 Tax=Nocardia sp. NBC_00881 TaxID=2975995 RepID=UPI0038677131|nr:hypothetical protein OH799_21155 [Nocardia sp. NBC_00881]
MKPTVLRTLLGAMAAGLICTASTVPAAAFADSAPAQPVPVMPAFTATFPPAPLLHALPEPLACLVTTGFALFCVGIT